MVALAWSDLCASDCIAHIAIVLWLCNTTYEDWHIALAIILYSLVELDWGVLLVLKLDLLRNYLKVCFSTFDILWHDLLPICVFVHYNYCWRRCLQAFPLLLVLNEGWTRYLSTNKANLVEMAARHVDFCLPRAKNRRWGARPTPDGWDSTRSDSRLLHKRAGPDTLSEREVHPRDVITDRLHIFLFIVFIRREVLWAFIWLLLGEACLATQVLIPLNIGRRCIITGTLLLLQRLARLWLFTDDRLIVLRDFGLHFLVDFKKVLTSCTDHHTVVESAKTFDSLWHKFLHKVHVRNYLWIAKATDDVDDNALEVVRVDEELLWWDVVSAPEQINLLTHLPCAAVVHPFKLAHWTLKAG